MGGPIRLRANAIKYAEVSRPTKDNYFKSSFAGRLLAGAASIFFGCSSTQSYLKEPQPSTIKCTVSPDEIRAWERETNTKGYRALDNPEVGWQHACYGDCLVVPLPPHEGHKDYLIASIHLNNGERLLIMSIAENIAHAASKPDYGSDYDISFAALFGAAIGELLVAGDIVGNTNLDKIFGSSTPAFRLVAHQGIDPKHGWFLQVRPLPVAERGAQPEFTGPVQTERLTFVLSRKAVFGRMETICPEMP